MVNKASSKSNPAGEKSKGFLAVFAKALRKLFGIDSKPATPKPRTRFPGERKKPSGEEDFVGKAAGGVVEGAFKVISGFVKWVRKVIRWVKNKIKKFIYNKLPFLRWVFEPKEALKGYIFRKIPFVKKALHPFREIIRPLIYTKWRQIYMGKFVRGFLKNNLPQLYKAWRWKTYVKAFWRGAKREMAKAVRGILEKSWKLIVKSAEKIAQVVIKLAAKLSALASKAAAMLSTTLLFQVGAVLLMVAIIAMVTISAVVTYEQFQRWVPGASESKYISLTKEVTVEGGGDVDNISPGDILNFRITVRAKEEEITNVVVRDEMDTYRDPGIYLIDKEWNDEHGYRIPDNYPEPRWESLSSGISGFTARQLIWEIDSMLPGEELTLVYQVRVHDSYDPGSDDGTGDGPICNSVEVTASEDQTGNLIVCANSRGSDALAVAADNLLRCLVDGSSDPNDVVYNQYDENCDSFNDKICPQAKDQFSASVAKHGHVTCVNFVVAAMNCAGISVPHAGHAYTWYEAYQGGIGSNFKVYSNGATPPRRGDILVFKGGTDGYGHIGIILKADGDRVRYAHANTGTKIGVKSIVNGMIEAPDNYEIPGFIRFVK